MRTRKFITALIFLLCMIGMLVPAYADGQPIESSSNTVTSVSLNEFELVRDFSHKSTAELAAIGYSTEEIEQIHNYRQAYAEHVEQLNQLEDDVLLHHGYTLDQISDIRNFTGDEAQMARIGATLTISTSTVQFNYDGNYSRGILAYTWKWNGVPEFKLYDMVSVSWNDWVVENNRSVVDYFYVSSGQAYGSFPATFTQDGNGTEGAAHKFVMQMENVLCYAKSGSGSFSVRSDVHAAKDFYYFIAYGHSRLTGNISFSVGVGGADASISFSMGVVTEASHSGNYRFAT